MRHSQTLYLAHTQPGFETIAATEISARLPGATVQRTGTVGDKNGLIWLSYAGDARDLLELRTLEDIFVTVLSISELPTSRDGLRVIERRAARARELEAALRIYQQVQPTRKLAGKKAFRVVSRQASRTAFRRIDAQRALEKGIATRPDYRWRLQETAALELWLTLLPDEALVALRISDNSMRHRAYKTSHLPASLRPSIAAALAWLSQPHPDDRFLDPMCGAGTILIERAHLDRYRMLLGGDLRQEAMDAARINIGPRYKPIELRQWDARQLPLDSGSISAAAVNLPFGKQLGTAQAARELYSPILAEMARVLSSGARFAVLTGDLKTFTASLRRSAELSIQARHKVRVLGQPAAICLLQRR